MSDPQESLGGAEATPDPTPFTRADRDPRDPGADELGGNELGAAELGAADPGAAELGGDDTVRANDELDGDVER